MDIANSDEKDVRAWLFKENVRISQERDKLEEERRAFEDEKRQTLLEIEHKKSAERIQSRRLVMEQELFDKRLEILEKEYRRLADDKKRFEVDKKNFDRQRKHYRQQSTVNNTTVYMNDDLLFNGVTNEIALKKRYRDLIKIFHPDNLNGDTGVIQSINRKYDTLKKMYS